MLEKFPYSLCGQVLLADDYINFSTSFTEILIRHIPTIDRVEVYHGEDDFINSDGSFTALKSVEMFRSLQSGDAEYGIIDGNLLLRFATAESDNIIAAAFGADPLFLKKLSPDWLKEKQAAITRELVLLKQARVDAQTGLLNLANLHFLLEASYNKDQLHLVLVELPPGTTALRNSVKHLYKCVSLLQNFVKGKTILHYIGQSTFALFLQQVTEEGAPCLESSLVAYLKKEGCPRVHVGSSKIFAKSDPPESAQERLHLLDEAWTALQRAVQKGPYSFCEYHHIAFPENQPLAPLSPGFLRKVSRWTSQMDRFALVLFRGDNDFSIASEIVPSLTEDYKNMAVDGDLYVLYPNPDKDALTKWVEDVISKAEKAGKSIQVSAGVFVYPFGDFRKSEALLACKKALLHAEFFGPSSYAVFDHLSLNISGDVYFGDGDFNLAIKEYRRGIRCGGGDLNLYNSLGVSLVMMNRLKAAVECFQNALKTDSRDFMALYNLGLARQSQGYKREAVDFFTKALEQQDNEDAEQSLISDLSRQLGILHCETGNYKEAVIYIESWLESEQKGADDGGVQYYLGLCYFHLGKMKQAMQSLERALRFNGFDDRALSLLGRAYNHEAQGADIAVTLCEKSVELDPENVEYKLYLAEVYIMVGDIAAARSLLKKCIGRKAYKPFAQMLMAEGYISEGENKRARDWLEKAVNNPLASQEIRKRAKRALKQL